MAKVRESTYFLQAHCGRHRISLHREIETTGRCGISVTSWSMLYLYNRESGGNDISNKLLENRLNEIESSNKANTIYINLPLNHCNTNILEGKYTMIM